MFADILLAPVTMYCLGDGQDRYFRTVIIYVLSHKRNICLKQHSREFGNCGKGNVQAIFRIYSDERIVLRIYAMFAQQSGKCC